MGGDCCKGAENEVNGYATNKVQSKLIVSEFTPIAKKLFSVARYLCALNYFWLLFLLKGRLMMGCWAVLITGSPGVVGMASVV